MNSEIRLVQFRGLRQKTWLKKLILPLAFDDWISLPLRKNEN